MYKYIFYISFSFFLLTANLNAFSQNANTEKQIEQYMDEAKKQMEAGDYEAANLTFRKLLALRATLPSEMCYYFAETLYKLNQLQNSKNFINQYFQLTGTSGQFYEEARALNKLVDEKFNDIKACNLCDSKGYRFSICLQCNGEGRFSEVCHYCKGKGITSCHACAGKGVKITQNAFRENEYKPCNVCKTQGYIACPTCEGSKSEKTTCTNCKGTGNLSTNKICNHLPLVENPAIESHHNH